MTTKDWLNRGWALDREITALESAKRRAYEKQFAYLDSMPQTATALKKTLAPRRVGGQQ